MLRAIRRIVGVLLLVVLVGGSWLWYRIGQIDVQRVTNDLYVLTGLGGNVGVLVTPAGVVVVDTMTFPRQGSAILRRIGQITDQPVTAILNTHYHQDHTHGNPAFTPGTRVIATEKTLEYLRTRDGAFWRDEPARELLPNETFAQTRDLEIGGKTVRATYFGRGHTGGDLVVLFVEDRVLQAGDLFFNGHYPNIDLEAGGSVREWSPTLDKVLGLDFDTVIPGHGPVSNRDGLRSFREFMTTLWTQTKTIVDRGGTLDDALRTVDIERFGLTRMWFAPYLDRGFVIRRAWQEASGGKTAG